MSHVVLGMVGPSFSVGDARKVMQDLFVRMEARAEKLGPAKDQRLVTVAMSEGGSAVELKGALKLAALLEYAKLQGLDKERVIASHADFTVMDRGGNTIVTNNKPARQHRPVSERRPPAPNAKATGKNTRSTKPPTRP